VAKQTRAQRRARRQQQAESGPAPIARAPQQVPADEPVKEQAVVQRQPRERGGFTRFLGESVGELKKVEWPNQNQVIQGTVVVLIACVIVGTYLWVADLVFKRLVQDVFLR
jgi:preprotein translocase subunit SecE